MEKPPLEVRGVQVRPTTGHKRTVRLDLVMGDGEMLSLALELPLVTRLTDQLIAVEYEGRKPAVVDTDTLTASDVAP